MSSIAASPASSAPWADRFLSATGVIWFCVAAVGQLAFIYFILAFYGTRTATGNLEGWNDKPLIDGHIEGDALGNVMFAVHALFAAVITLGGLMQLVPQLRSRAPGLHRWTGRTFIVIAFVMALGGLWLVWGRGTYLSVISGLAITGNAVAILVFATLAWRFAVARRIDTHRRWAMRTFMVVNGVWFLRVGLMAWVILNQGPVGMNQTLSGPVDIALVFGCYLIPLAALELYFAAQRSPRAWMKAAVGGMVLGLTGITAIGVFGTVALMWGPYF